MQRKHWEQALDRLTHLYSILQCSESEPRLLPERSEYWEIWWELLWRNEEQWREATDAAARTTASGSPPENIPDEVRAWLELRLQWAMATCEMLSDADTPDGTQCFPTIPATPDDETKTAEWLLIDVWHRHGRFYWLRLGYWEFDWYEASRPKPPKAPMVKAPPAEDHFGA